MIKRFKALHKHDQSIIKLIAGIFLGVVITGIVIASFAPRNNIKTLTSASQQVLHLQVITEQMTTEINEIAELLNHLHSNDDNENE